MHMRQVMSILSEPKFGEDETDFFKRQMQELGREVRSGSIGLADLREACRLKYLQAEVLSLIRRLDTEESPAAMKRAMALLLKEVFFV